MNYDPPLLETFMNQKNFFLATKTLWDKIAFVGIIVELIGLVLLFPLATFVEPSPEFLQGAEGVSGGTSQQLEGIPNSTE